MSDRNYNKKRKICPTELEMSDKNCNKKQDISDRARYVPTKMIKKKPQYMSDRARDV